MSADIPAPSSQRSVGHSPAEFARELSAKQATRSRHVCVLLGAGASRAANVPDLRGLGDAVKDELRKTRKAEVESLFQDRNLEEVLTRLRRAIALLEPGEKIGNLDKESARGLEAAVTREIVRIIENAPTRPEVYTGLAAWAAGQDRSLPVEIFTLNYDLLLEQALESLGATYFDGFAGHLRGRFRADLVEALGLSTGLVVPSSFVRLWKLHGSINWSVEETGDGRRDIVRLGSPASTEEVAAIYPSEEKYTDSRRVPFLALHDRFRRSLDEPETLLLVAGYSFGDQHVNEVLFDSLFRHRRSEAIVFCHDSIPELVRDKAKVNPNLVVTSPSEAIIGGDQLPWRGENEVPGVWEGSYFKLGDFATLSAYVATLEGGENEPS